MGKKLRNIVLGGLALLMGVSFSDKDMENLRQRKTNEELFFKTVAEYVDTKSRAAAGENRHEQDSNSVDVRLLKLDRLLGDDLDFFTKDAADRAEDFERKGYVCYVINSVNIPGASEYVFGKIVKRENGEYKGKKYEVIEFESLSDSLDTILYKEGRGVVRMGFVKNGKIYMDITATKLLAERFYEEGKEMKKGPVTFYGAASLKTYDEILERIKGIKGDEKGLFMQEFIRQDIEINIIHEREHLFSDDEKRAYIAQLSQMPTYHDLQFVLRTYPDIEKEMNKFGFDKMILLSDKRTIKGKFQMIYDNLQGK